MFTRFEKLPRPASKLTNCFYCDNPLPATSEEHIFNSSWGGSYKDKNLICYKCNSSFSKTIRIEYAVYYLLNNGQYSRKVFKISENKYLPMSQFVMLRKQSFRPIRTRTFHKGKHKLSVILNGKESATKSFELI